MACVFGETVGTRLRLLACLALGVLALAGAAQEYGEGSHHYPMRHGRVTKLWHGGGHALATLRLGWDSGRESPGLEEKPMRAVPGMGVMVEIAFGTAFLRMPVGRIQRVSSDGAACVVLLDETLLARTVQNPTDQSIHRVREFLVVGAEVAVSTEPF